jgi:molybdopterin synthase catalytic subunit
MDKILKNIFVEGPISSEFIAKSIQKHSTKTNIGAHSIFLGQVRADIIDEKTVTQIDYTSHVEMALTIMQSIREQLFEQYELTCLHVYHSLGKVAAGEICLFVFTSSKHRKMAIEACEELVERIKLEIPIWGKEIFLDQTHQWKENK